MSSTPSHMKHCSRPVIDRELFFYLFFHSTESAHPFTPQKEYGLLKTDLSPNSGWHRAWIQPRRIIELSENILSTIKIMDLDLNSKKAGEGRKAAKRRGSCRDFEGNA